MVEVRPDGYTLTGTDGEMHFCNARCLCIWAVQLAPRPNLADGRQLPGVQLTQPKNVCGRWGTSKMAGDERTSMAVSK
jgi:hypothetical protein